MDNAVNEMWRAQHNAATRVAEGWLGLLQPGANRAPHTPTPSTSDDQTQTSASGDTSAEDTSAEPGSTAAIRR
jgi:hypothetical protein